MANDPHATLRFPKVAAVEEPRPEAEADPAPRISVADVSDDPPTLRAPLVTALAGHPTVERASLTVLAGLNAGQVLSFEKEETIIGRGRHADFRADDAGVSRRHARVRRVEGRYVLEDLGSTNGVLVNGRRVERIDLATGDRIQIGPGLVLRFAVIAADEEALARRLYESSTRDGLTQLYNRKYASERLAAEVAYAHRHGTLLSLILCDIDHFKRVNDTYGHAAGDVVLRIVAAQTLKTIRTEDVLARYGGEEFLVIVRGIEHKNVTVLADRIRAAVERLSVPWESRKLRVSVSLGVASLSERSQATTGESLVALADERLYRAKATGRNRVVAS